MTNHTSGNDKGMCVSFESWDKLYDYIADICADFIRDRINELNNHPMDYDDHYIFNRELFLEWIKDYGDD